MDANSPAIGIVVATHGAIGEALVAAATDILGPVERLTAVALDGLGAAAARQRLEAAVAEVDGAQGVLLLTDLFGGSPANLALAIARGRPIDVVTGVNLPMLLKTILAREEVPRLGDLAELAVAYGREQILRPAELLAQRRKATAS